MQAGRVEYIYVKSCIEYMNSVDTYGACTPTHMVPEDGHVTAILLFPTIFSY